MITPIAVKAVTIVNVAPTPHTSMSSCDLWAFRRASKAWYWAVELASKASMRVMTSGPDMLRTAWVALYALPGATSGQHIAALSSASLGPAVLRNAPLGCELSLACERLRTSRTICGSRPGRSASQSSGRGGRAVQFWIDRRHGLLRLRLLPARHWHCATSRAALTVRTPYASRPTSLDCQPSPKRKSAQKHPTIERLSCVCRRIASQ